MRTPEVPTPEVIYHPFYRTSYAPYSVNINGPLCGSLLRSFGMPDARIEQLKIIISPEIRSESWSTRLGESYTYTMGSYVERDHSLFLYPTVYWNIHQQLLASLKLLTQDSAIMTIIANNRVADFKIVTTHGKRRNPDQKQFEQEVQKSAKHIVTKQQTQQMIRYAKVPESLADAESILVEAVNKRLRRDLAHELKHSLDKPASTWTAVYAALGVYFGGRRVIPGLMYMVDLGEIRARRFATRISNDPNWQDLIRTAQIQ